MKKLVSCIMALCLLFSQAQCVFAQQADGGEGNAGAFVTMKIPFPDTIDESDAWRTYVRYKDTKEAISLSEYYDGYMCATVPAENKDRELEAFLPEKVKFTDIPDGSEYFDMEWLAYTGVIKGNGKGEAQPQRNITRAEAAAMVMRFIGLESMPEANQTVNFSDVSKNDWFYSAVMSAYKCGIVNGTSETTFSPKRSVTREEFNVMTARALQYASLRCPADNYTTIVDKDEISEWAKDSFDYLAASRVYDYADNKEDPEDPLCFVKPKNAATRVYAAALLNNVQGICQTYASDTAIKFGFDKEMPVIDGSTSTYPFTEVVYETLFLNGRTHQQFPQKHSKTHASYERLINGEVDMLFASHHPANDIVEMAKEKGVEFELIPIAYDAMVFFTNADNPATGLTKEQISNIYVNNAYKNWSEIGGSSAFLYPYCRNNDSGSHAQMEKHFLNGHEIHPDIKLETSYTMTNILTDVMAAQTDDPVGYGLGYSIYYFFNNMDYFFNTKTELKLLAIDGVMPTDETIANGTYPLANNTYIVLRKDEPKNSPARKMAEFMLTDEGQACVESAGYGRLTESQK